MQWLVYLKELVDIMMHELKSVIFSDECYVYLGLHSGFIYCIQSADEVWHENCIVSTFTKSPVHVMVWGCIMYRRKGLLIMLEYLSGKSSGMTAKQYIEQIFWRGIF